MEVTGAALSVDISWWYLVDFVFSQGKWITSDAEMDVDLTVTSESGKVVSIKRLCCNEASEIDT